MLIPEKRLKIPESFLAEINSADEIELTVISSLKLALMYSVIL